MRKLTEIQQVYGGAGVPAIGQGSIIDMTPEEIAIAKTPPPTVAEEMKTGERERRIAAEEARLERKREHARTLLIKIHGRAKAATLRPDLFEAEEAIADDDQGEEEGEQDEEGFDD